MQLLAYQRPFQPEFILDLCRLAQAVFQSPSAESEEIEWRLNSMPDAVVHCAQAEGQVLGFKIAYATRSRRLYSWLGGVDPSQRRRGIGLALMEEQHRWAKERGYLNVETGTIRNNVPMLTLNLKCGFEIIGTYARAGRTRVLMAKRLRA